MKNGSSRIVHVLLFHLSPSTLVMNTNRVIACAVLALLLAACGGSARPVLAGNGCNVVVVCIDALRADHLGLYGYARKTSPFLDSLAVDGMVFEHASSHSTFTRESVSALFSGVPPSENPTGAGWFAKPDPDRKNLAELFADAGYRTGFFTDQPTFEEPTFAKGFSDYEKLPTPFGGSGSGSDLSKRALTFTAKAAGKPFMMYLHYLDPHEPYAPKDDFYFRFAKERFPKPLDVMRDIRPVCHNLIKEGFGPGDPRFEDLVLRYDAEIAETDAAVETLFRGLKEQGVLDKTIVVVTADHGEEFLDHGFVEHAWTVYEEVLRVPLIIWRPGMVPAGRSADRVKQVDLLPTLTRLTEVPCNRTDLAGEALFTKNNGAWTFAAPVKPVIAEMLLQTRSNIRAVIQDGYKYIASPKWLTPEGCAEAVKQQKIGIAQVRAGKFKGYEPFGPTVHEALYDLKADPGEKNDLMAQAPDKAQSLKSTLDAFVAKCAKLPHRYDAPANTVLTPEMEALKKQLGY